jgi:hypothetical protein
MKNPAAAGYLFSEKASWGLTLDMQLRKSSTGIPKKFNFFSPKNLSYDEFNLDL